MVSTAAYESAAVNCCLVQTQLYWLGDNPIGASLQSIKFSPNLKVWGLLRNGINCFQVFLGYRSNRLIAGMLLYPRSVKSCKVLTIDVGLTATFIRDEGVIAEILLPRQNNCFANSQACSESVLLLLLRVRPSFLIILRYFLYTPLWKITTSSPST